jgi:hypothetical protein
MKIMKHIIALMVGLVALGAQAQTGNWDDFRASKFSQQSNMLKTIGIQNEAELALLSYAINHDEPNINGYTINLARDLDMSAHWFTPIGSTDAHAFKGVFDGNGYHINIKIDDKGAFAGLFRHISNASVRHLKLTGSVTGGIHSAGLIGHTLSGTNNHTDDCLVSVQVTCSDNGVSAPHGGGIIGHAEDAVNTVFGCLFNGTITAADTKVEGRKRAGAIIGWSNTPGNQHITDCVEMGNYNGFDDKDIMPVYAMSESEQQPVLTRVSHSHPWMYQGRPMRQVKCDEPYYAIKKGPFGTLYKTSKIEINHDLLRVDEALFSFDDCTFDYELACLLQDHIITHISVNYSPNDGHTIKMGRGSDCIIRAMTFNPNTQLKGSGTEDDPYQIHNDREWNYVCYQLEQGNSFKDKHFRLEADLTLRFMAGTEATPFSGIFDGNGDNRRLEVKIGNIETDDTGLFRYAKDAQFKYFHINGSVYSTRTCIGGLIGRASGKVLVRNCRVSASFHADYHGAANVGGLIGVTANDNPDVTVRACRFDGSVDGINASGWAGMVGWKKEGSLKVQNCLFAPVSIHVKTSDNQNFARGLSNDEIATSINYYLSRFESSTQGRDASAMSAGYMVEQLGTNDWEQLDGYGDPSPVLGPRGIPLQVSSSNDLRGLAKRKEKRALNINVGEILHNDGHFNTICLPFNQVFMNIVIADGAELYQFASVKQEGTADKLVFLRTNTIQAGVPYLLRWTGQTSYTDRSHIWFTGVTVTAEQPATIEHGDYAFCGTFDEISLRKASEEGLYVMGGDDNWHPVISSTSEARLLGAFRGFLRLTGGNGAPFLVSLEDAEGNTTAIIPVTAQPQDFTTPSASPRWYNLNGQQIEDFPTAKGIYIHQGKKVVISRK